LIVPRLAARAVACPFLAFVLLLPAISTSSARTWRIRADRSGDAATIQAGIDSAMDGDTVLLEFGVYKGVGNRKIDFRGKAITVTSEHGPHLTVIDCQRKGYGFNIHNGEGRQSVLSNVTITNGYNYSSAAGECHIASPTLRGLIVSNCEAEAGAGGIFLFASNALIDNCTFKNNHAGQSGGAIVSSYYSTPQITGCSFVENSATLKGGAIYVSNNSDGRISGNQFLQNNAERGGAIFCYGLSNPLITDNLFSENSVQYNGGALLCAYRSTPLITFNIFYANTAMERGGAIYLNEVSPTIRNNTLSENRGVLSGSGIVCYGPGAQPLIENTIIAYGRGTGSSAFAIHCAKGGMPTVTCSDIYGNEDGDTICGIDGGGNFSSDPAFCGELGTGNLLLQSDSPYLGANNSCGALIGALSIGCGATAVHETTWGLIKARFRD
jgi:predicted outer membrane repeat protein